jgi:hypothetical protein
VWNTVWEGNETIVVKDAASKAFNFVNSVDEPSKFTCYEAGAGELLGKSVNITIANPEQSKVGKRGLAVSVDVESFDNTKTIKLEATNSFLRYTYNGDGKVELSLTYEGGKAFVYSEGQTFDTVAFEGVKGENFVSFNAPAEGIEAELAYSIDGIEVKRKAINVFAGTIYNLGELAMPYETSVYSVVGTHNGWEAGKTPMYLVGDYAVAYGVEFTALRYFASKSNCPAMTGNVIIFAAGNDANPSADYPGAYNQFLCVTAFGPDGLPTSYTNYNLGCNVSAPGGDFAYDGYDDKYDGCVL